MPAGVEGGRREVPVDAIREAGYEAVWHGQKAWNGVAILARGEKPEETRRGLPGDPDDTHSRYIEAVVGGLTIGCLYLPNGNPARAEVRLQTDGSSDSTATQRACSRREARSS